MTETMLERLLFEEESDTLDFKRQQYLFAKASEDDKSELLKDILGFVNAWRRTDAYILIGVEDVRGGRGNVVGISGSDHLDDHSLQQWVNNLTNRPIRFHYEAFGFEGKQIGILRIEERQSRPVFLKKDYGKLKKNDVYVRRGSSTDPGKPATPDEVALMGRESGSGTAELVVEFAEVDRDDSRGVRIAWDAEFCHMPPEKSIPDLVRKRQGDHYLGIDLSELYSGPFNRPNGDYFRELAKYEFVRRLFRPVRLVVRNTGKVSANSVQVELSVPMDLRVVVMSELPARPERHNDYLPASAMADLQHPLRHGRGEVSIDQNAERFRIEINFGDLQPGKRVWSDVFFVGKGISGDLALSGHVYASNLPQPKDFALHVTVDVTMTSMTVDELKGLTEPPS